MIDFHGFMAIFEIFDIIKNKFKKKTIEELITNDSDNGVTVETTTYVKNYKVQQKVLNIDLSKADKKTKEQYVKALVEKYRKRQNNIDN